MTVCRGAEEVSRDACKGRGPSCSFRAAGGRIRPRVRGSGGPAVQRGASVPSQVDGHGPRGVVLAGAWCLGPEARAKAELARRLNDLAETVLVKHLRSLSL